MSRNDLRYMDGGHLVSRTILVTGSSNTCMIKRDQDKVKTQDKLGRHFSWSSAHFREKFPRSDVESLEQSRRPSEMSEKFDTNPEVYISIFEHAVMFSYWNISHSLNLITVL